MKDAPINLLPPLPDWPIAKQFKSPQEVVDRLEFAKREESTLVAACWIAAHWLKSADAAILADRAAAPAPQPEGARQMPNVEELLKYLRLIQHATAPTPDDDGSHENAYSIATEALERAGNPPLDNAARELAELVIAMQMVTPHGLKARQLARKVLGIADFGQAETARTADRAAALREQEPVAHWTADGMEWVTPPSRLRVPCALYTHPSADLRAELAEAKAVVERNMSMHLAIEEAERKRAERAEAERDALKAELAQERAARGNGVLVPGTALAKMQAERNSLRALLQEGLEHAGETWCEKARAALKGTP
jgi:hypothetical protein